MKYTIVLLAMVFSINFGEENSSGESNLQGLNADCVLPIVIGHCSVGLTRYAFMPAIDACVQFTYGGCGGNNNNFRTHEDCNIMCLGLPSDVSGDDYKVIVF